MDQQLDVELVTINPKNENVTVMNSDQFYNSYSACAIENWGKCGPQDIPEVG